MNKTTIAASRSSIASHILSKIFLAFSPIKGPEGNIEFLVLLKKTESVENHIDEDIINDVVQKSHGMDV